MARLQFDGRQFKLTLPKKLLEALGWKKGDNVIVEVDFSGGIVLRNSSSVSDVSGSGSYKRREEERIEYAR